MIVATIYQMQALESKIPPQHKGEPYFLALHFFTDLVSLHMLQVQWNLHDVMM